MPQKPTSAALRVEEGDEDKSLQVIIDVLNEDHSGIC